MRMRTFFEAGVGLDWEVGTSNWEVERPQRAMLTKWVLEMSRWPLVSSLLQGSLVLHMMQEQQVTMAPSKLGQRTSLHRLVQRKKQRSLPDVLTWHGTSGTL